MGDGGRARSRGGTGFRGGSVRRRYRGRLGGASGGGGGGGGGGGRGRDIRTHRYESRDPNRHSRRFEFRVGVGGGRRPRARTPASPARTNGERTRFPTTSTLRSSRSRVGYTSTTRARGRVLFARAASRVASHASHGPRRGGHARRLFDEASAARRAENVESSSKQTPSTTTLARVLGDGDLATRAAALGATLPPRATAAHAERAVADAVAARGASNSTTTRRSPETSRPEVPPSLPPSSAAEAAARSIVAGLDASAFPVAAADPADFARAYAANLAASARRATAAPIRAPIRTPSPGR